MARQLSSWYTAAGRTSHANSSMLTNNTLETLELRSALPNVSRLYEWAAPLGADITRVIEIGAGEGRVLLELCEGSFLL